MDVRRDLKPFDSGETSTQRISASPSRQYTDSRFVDTHILLLSPLGTRFRLLLPDLRLNTDVPYRALQEARIRALCLTYLQQTWDPCQVPERLRLRVDNTHGLAGLCRFRDYITGQLWSGFEASATMTTFVMEVAGATRTLGEWLMEGTVSWLRGMSYWW
ncbi:hypothetical protein SEVIR_9G278201v4 [Setaria viridis]